MSDVISRQAAIAYAISGRTREFEGEKWIRVSEVRESIQTMTSAQPERKNGKWEWDEESGAFLCSKCNSGYKDQPTLMGKPLFEYCPVCGAYMGGETDGN